LDEQGIEPWTTPSYADYAKGVLYH